MNNLRVGNGYDVHRLVEGRKLILGGVEIEFDKGLDGHSDADVLTHAIMDSLLGASGLADIGYYFPPTDSKFKDANSLDLLKEVLRKIDKLNFTVINIDCMIIAEAPKFRPYIERMRKNLSEVLKIPFEQINVKATTNEKIGFIGRGEGIAATAVCLISKDD